MRKFFKDFKLGLTSYGKAWKFIREKKMWGYFLPPVLLSLVLSFSMYYIRNEIQEYIEITLNSLINFNDWWEWAQWLTGWIIQLSLLIFSWYIYIKVQKYTLLIFLSPVLAYLSEKTEEKLTGKTHEFNLDQFVKDIFRGVLIASRNLVIEISLLVMLFLLGLIPILAPFTTAAAFIIGWYFYGYSLMDYSNERKKLNIQESNLSIKSRSGAAIANGMIFELIFIIPILGFVVAPILGTIAATISMQEKTTNTAQKQLK
jgi:CysZ protein